MNLGHRKRGWSHVSRGRRSTHDADGRPIESWRDEHGVWRLFVFGDEVGKAKAFRLIAKWVRNRSYLLCL